MKSLHDLAETWLQDADVLERHGDDRGAELLRLHAGELQGAIREHRREALTLAEAAEASGYSRSHLRHLVADGTIPNAGRSGAPRILRRDLPVKPGSGRGPAPGDVEGDAEEIVKSLGDAA